MTKRSFRASDPARPALSPEDLKARIAGMGPVKEKRPDYRFMPNEGLILLPPDDKAVEPLRRDKDGNPVG